MLADLLFVTSPEAITNLGREGVSEARVHFVGNPMIDTLLRLRGRFDAEAARRRYDLPDRYGVVTLHRPSNVDTDAAAGEVVRAIMSVAASLPLILPLHPRGRATLEAAGLVDGSGLTVVDPLGYIEFMSLVSGASVVITDSGGIQEETTILGVPCLTLRPNTERPITITNGTNRLVRTEGLPAAVSAALSGTASQPPDPPPLWDGRAGARIAAAIAEWLSTDG